MNAVDPAYEINAHSGDRLGFGLFIAVAVHACLIFGLTIKQIERDTSVADLEVTLVTHYSEDTPMEADFWAQQNQEASGTEEDVLMPTTTVTETSQGEGDADGQEAQQSKHSEQNTGMQVVSTRSSSSSSEIVDIDVTEEEQSIDAEEMAHREAILARLDALQQDYAQRPRVGTLTSVSAKARDDAEYQLHLQEKIIANGNTNYPRASLDQGVFGSLRLMLTILQDGSIESVDILESSGERLLDQAALEIARTSAPFQPFPSGTAARYDKIVFIRTWQFLPGGRLLTGE